MNSDIDPRDGKSRLSVLVAFIALLMLPNLIWLCFQHGLTVWVTGLIVPVSLLLLFFALLGNWLWIACLLLIPFAVLAPLETFYIAEYHHPTSAEVLATLFATNPRETREYLGNALMPLAFCMGIALWISLLATWQSRRSHLQWRQRSRALVLAVAIAAPLASATLAGFRTKGNVADQLSGGRAMLISLINPIESGYPFGLFQRLVSYLRQWTNLRHTISSLDHFRFHAHRTNTIRRRQVYVLVIGEASRRDHWQLFGYPLATTPELMRIAHLIPIPDLDSSWPESNDAIPMIVTRKPATVTSLSWNEASILRAMQEAGFETWWISNQMEIGKFDSAVATYAFEAQHVRYLNRASWSAPGSYDEDLFKPLRNALKSTHDQFIVLHMMGSHLDYDFRYPNTYKHFRPIEKEPADDIAHGEHVRNSYDNSILYTDHVLATIIGILSESATVSTLWYESDHGETLPTPTCPFEGHGLGSRYEFQIPALLWYSDAYALAYPARLASLRTNANKPSMSANTFESLIDMAGVTFAGHDSTWSLFSPQWQYRPRIVNGEWRVDIDHAKLGTGCELVVP